MCLKFDCMCNTQLPDDLKLRYKMSLSGGSGAVFFLGSRAHYQVLDQPYDKDNENTSTETIGNTSVEELWPKEKTVDEKNSDIGKINWNIAANDINSMFHERQFQSGNHCIKRRAKRHSTEALLGEDLKPSALNKLNHNEPEKKTSRRSSVMQFLSSFRRKRGPEVQYLQQMDTGIISCTYRESCRCLDCQGRYFECAEESEDYSSDDEDHYYVETPGGLNDDDLYLVPRLVEEGEKNMDQREQHKPEEKARNESGDSDNQLQMEVAASTSAMLNLLLYHPFSCAIQ